MNRKKPGPRALSKEEYQRRINWKRAYIEISKPVRENPELTVVDVAQLVDAFMEPSSPGQSASVFKLNKYGAVSSHGVKRRNVLVPKNSKEASATVYALETLGCFEEMSQEQIESSRNKLLQDAGYEQVSPPLLVMANRGDCRFEKVLEEQPENYKRAYHCLARGLLNSFMSQPYSEKISMVRELSDILVRYRQSP